MTVPTNPTDRPSPTPTRPIVDAAVTALALFHPTDPEQAVNMLTFWARRGELTDADIVEIQDRMFPDDCPDWCTFDHTGDDPADPIENLILHMGDDHTDGSVRKMLDVHEGSKLDIRVARTDCPSEGTVGKPALMIRADLELTTWEQAGELARTILDAFGYLLGADQD